MYTYCVTSSVILHNFRLFLDLFMKERNGPSIEDSEPIIKPITSKILGVADLEYKYYVIDTMQGCPADHALTNCTVHTWYRARDTMRGRTDWTTHGGR